MPIDAVDDAVMAKLQGDATLLTLAPGKVHRDFAPEGSVDAGVFVIVIQQTELVNDEQGGIAHTVGQYRVIATAASPLKTQAQAALDRVDALLNNQPLTIAGQTHMLTRRVLRESRTEVDGPVIWRRQIADYEIWSDPSA